MADIMSFFDGKSCQVMDWDILVWGTSIRFVPVFFALLCFPFEMSGRRDDE